MGNAFLQSEPTSADAQLWTSGVAELREALGVGPEGVMKILRNIYGSTTAPRVVSCCGGLVSDAAWLGPCPCRPWHVR